MSKFVALIDENNNVENVILVDDNYNLSSNEIEVSSSSMMRGAYIPETGKFRSIKVYSSWVESTKFEDPFNEVLGWNPPTPMPTPDSDGDTTQWSWDEDTTSWVAV